MTEITTAARLIAYGIDRRARPGADTDYRTLLDRYLTDPAFAETVRQICAGLGLFVAGTARAGIILTSIDDGPFTVTLSDLTTDGVTDRLLHGLVVLAVAALGYPDSESLDGTATPTVQVTGIERLLNSHAEQIVELAADDPDIDPQASTAAAEWLNRNAIAETDRGGRIKKGCRRWYVTRTLDLLCEQGLARPERALGDDTYQLTDRFRITVATTAASAVYRHLAAANSNMGAP